MIRVTDITRNIESLLREEGEAMAKALKGEVPVAEGKLRDSITSTVSVSGGLVILQIEAAPHYKFVRDGRKAGSKMPPVSNIERWCTVKGIDVKAAWPIAISIAKKGIKPKARQLEGVFNKRGSDIRRKIERAFLTDVRIIGEEIVGPLRGNKSNIT